MNRFFQAFNFLGVVALALLCGAQWRANRDLNLYAIGLENTRTQLTATVAERDRTIKGNLEDLDDLHRRLTLSEDALKDANDKFLAVSAERDKLAIQRDRLIKEGNELKSSLQQWMTAVAARDAEIKKANDQIQQLAADRNEAVAKFNDLAGRYNDVTGKYNDAVTKCNEAVEKYNDLAAKYDGVVKELNAARARP